MGNIFVVPNRYRAERIQGAPIRSELHEEESCSSQAWGVSNYRPSRRPTSHVTDAAATAAELHGIFSNVSRQAVATNYANCTGLGRQYFHLL